MGGSDSETVEQWDNDVNDDNEVMEKHILSKSTFIRGVQCLKSLYLNKKRPFLRDKIPQERLLVFKRGHKVGEMAHAMFPGGINMSPGHPSAYRKAIIRTQEQINEGYPVIYEAAFQHEQVMILLDILVHTQNGWHAYEVKSSASISETYLMDAALQHYVIRGSGLEITGISIIHINREYVREEEIDVHHLFSIVDVTDEALSRRQYVAEQIRKEKETLLLTKSPLIEVGPHCHEPYDCDFIGHCWKKVPKPAALPPLENFKAETITGLKKVTGKVGFIKFLTIKTAIPAYRGTKPYQEIAFAYCIKTEKREKFVIFGHEENPHIKLVPELAKDISGLDTLICFGQDSLCKLFPKKIKIIDLLNAVLENSSLQKTRHGESLLGKIIEISRSEIEMPAYGSDAVCTHHYLEEYPSAEVSESIKEYASKWTEGIARLHGFLVNS